MERRRADGTMEIAPISTEGLAPVQAAFYAFAATRPGLLLEDKGRTIALHYRLAPDQGPEVRRLAQALVGAVPGTLRLLEGDKVVEVQPVGFDKGRAIRSFLMEPPFGGRRPVFIGDDITDEDGFAAVAEQGGIAIRVTRDRAELPRTLAPFELGTIEAVYAWLEAAADRLEAGKRNVERPIAAAP
jgi:trehalose 6-phosphate phosphatase